MNPFWSVAGYWVAVALGVAAALAFVLPPLLRGQRGRSVAAARRDINLAVYRDQMQELKAELSQAQVSAEQYQAHKLELEVRAAEDALAPPAPVVTASSRRLGFALAGLIPVAAFGLYFWLGNPGVVSAIASGKSPVAPVAVPATEDILKMIGELESRTRANPSDGAVWEALGMANAAVARWPDAARAYQEAYRLLPVKPSVLAGYAESLAMVDNQVLSGRPIELVTQALRLDPGLAKGLELAALHAYQTRDFAQATVFFDRLLQRVDPASPYARDVLAMRNDAERRAAPTAATAPAPAPTAGRIAGQVDVAEALKPRLGQQGTIFVLARAGETGPPLAAVRLPMGPLPLSFDLNDTMAMIAGQELSKHKAVILVARISASGNPMAQSGDLEGRLTNVAVGSQGVKLTIDRVVP